MTFKIQDSKVSLQNLRKSVDQNKEEVTKIIEKETDQIHQELKEKIKEFLLLKTISPEDVMALLANKADKCEIVEINTHKADKKEILSSEQKSQVMTKQMQHLSMILVEIIKILNTDLDPNNPELGNSKFLQQQALKVFEWIKGKGGDSHIGKISILL